MTITRDGKEIRLTQAEIHSAWQVQQREYYMSEVAYAIECYNDGCEELQSINEDKFLANQLLCDAFIEAYKEELFSNDGERWQDVLEQLLAVTERGEWSEQKN